MDKVIIKQTLADRLAEVGRNEQALVAKGYIVFELVKDLDFWAETGITTAEQFNAMLDAEYEKEVRKSSYDDYFDDYGYDDDTTSADEYYYERDRQAYLDSTDYDGDDEAYDDEQDRLSTLAEEIVPEPFYALCEHYQPGWN